MNAGRHPGNSTNSATWDDPGRCNTTPFWQFYEEQTSTSGDYDTSIEIVKPYAIEEPDDEEDQLFDETPQSTEPTPQWQKDLVDFMDDLQCESDSSGSSLSSNQTRGQKRKSPNTASQDRPLTQSPPEEAQHERPQVSPKRRCRKSKGKQPHSDLEAVHAAFVSHASSDTWSSVRSGSDTPFTDVSSPGDMCNESPALDEMDTD